MELVTRMFVTASQWRSGRAMAECAIVLAVISIAIEIFVTYEVVVTPLPHL